MLGVLDGLGISTRADEATATIEVDGCGGHLPGTEAHVDANQSGTTARFAVPLAALGEVPVVVDAHPQMRGRPMGDQFAALRSMGVTITELGEPDRLPARITGPIDGAETSLPGDTSSQFITGLLLAGGASSMQVALTTEPISRPYIEMTGAVMRSFGAAVDDDGDRRWALAAATSAPTTAWSRMPLLRRTFWPQLRSPEVGFVSTGSGEMHSRAMSRSPRCSGRWVAVSTLAPTMSRCPGERVAGRGRSERYLRHRADACRGGGVRRVTHPGRRHRLHP